MSDLFKSMVSSPEFQTLLSEQVMKALSAGNVTGETAKNSLGLSGAPLKEESLESQLKVLTETGEMNPYRMYAMIPRVKVGQTVHRYARVRRLADKPASFVPEGVILPYGTDGVFDTQSVVTKYLQEVRQISKQLLQSNNLLGSNEAAIEAEYTKQGMMSLAKTQNALLYRSDSSTNPLAYDGLLRQHSDAQNNFIYWGSENAYLSSGFIKDKRGAAVTEADLGEAAVILREQGFADDSKIRTWFTPSAMNQYTQQLSNTKFVNIGNMASQTGMTGQRPNGFISTIGDTFFEQDIFFRRREAIFSTNPAVNQSFAPATPTTPVVTVVADASNPFTGYNGTYLYAVTAFNAQGESAPLLLTPTPQAVTAAQKVVLSFSDVSGGATAATGFRVYRSEVNPTGLPSTVRLYPILEVSKAQLTAGFPTGAAAGTIEDTNRFIPNTEEVIMMEYTKNVLEFGCLGSTAPMKTTIASGVNLFNGAQFFITEQGALMLYAPAKMYVFRNVRIK